MIAFFHGLESPPKSDKSEYLESTFGAYCPEMNYRQPGLFDKTLKEVKDKKVTFLIGSSMGGWFAYCMSTLTGIPTLLFNPAMHSRSMQPTVSIGKKKANHVLVLGKNDTVIDPVQTVLWCDDNGIGSFKYYYEDNDHRTPIGIFKKYVNKYAVNEKLNVLSFNEFLIEKIVK
jgi:uncharacterized protein